MDLLRISGATLNQTPLDFSGNAERIRVLLKKARAEKVELLCLPELSISGYGCEDAFFSLHTSVMAEKTLASLLDDTEKLTVVFSLPYYFSGAMYNCAVMVQDKKILGVNAKRVLPKEGVHYEPRWFRPWPFGKVVETTICGQKVPLGDLRYRLGRFGIAIEICEEAWDAIPASAAHADAVDIILNPSASHFALGKYKKRENLVANSSRSMQVIYVYSNLVGLEAGRMIYDGGVLFAEGGEIVKRGRRFGFHDSELVWMDVNPDRANVSKLKSKPVRDMSSESHLQVMPQLEVKGADPRVIAGSSDERRREASAVTTQPTFTKEQELLQALMLGLYDYMRKTKSKGYMVSLSGGCDSSTVSIAVAHMLAEAVKQDGLEVTCQRLHVSSKNIDSVNKLVHACLTCIYQGTKNSGPVTLAAAKAVATEVSASFHQIELQPAVDFYQQTVEKMIGRPLDWKTDDIAMQNIQARARVPGLWMLANIENKILLTTSNRSEASVGYATMDGDTAGGLAPIAGIDKNYLRSWLKWAETQAGIGLGPLPALALVNKQSPTAELRPGKENQTDEADLMPYDILDRIESAFVRDRLSPEDILDVVSEDFPSVKSDILAGYVKKFFRLWTQSQWKRERLAPAFHLDEASVDPRTWCRYPILSVAPE